MPFKYSIQILIESINKILKTVDKILTGKIQNGNRIKLLVIVLIILMLILLSLEAFQLHIIIKTIRLLYEKQIISQP